MGDVPTVELLILVLATWRITSLVVEESGPWFIFERFRHLVGVRVDKTYPNLKYGRNEFARGLLCFYCSSLWVGVLLSLLYILDSSSVVVLLLPFSLSGGSILVSRVLDSLILKG